MEGLRPDIAAAHQRMHGRIGVKRAVRKLPEHLWPGERVDAMAAGVYGTGAGLFVLTDRRVLLVVEGLVHRATEDFTFDRMTSVEWSSGMMTGRIVVFAGGTRAEMMQVDKNDGRAIVEAVRARMHAGSGGPGGPAQPYRAPHPYGGGQAWQGQPPAAAPAPPPLPPPPPWESPSPWESPQPHPGEPTPSVPAPGPPATAPVPVPPAPPATAPVPPAPGLVALLRELATLRDEGILTEEEFAAQKAKLLG